jgi:hypothetical protein
MAKFKAGDKVRPIPGKMGVGFRPYHLTILAVGSQTYYCQYDGLNHNKCEMIVTIEGLDGTYELFEEPKTRTGYMNILENFNGDLVVSAFIYDTADLASRVQPQGTVGRIKVTITKGVFEE